MENFQSKLEKYAELAVKVGINLQKNQNVVIDAPVKSADFVRILVKKAYEAGAKNVYIDWDDGEVNLIRYMHAPMEAFGEYPMWKAKGYVEMAKEGTAFLSVGAPNPDLYKNVDPERMRLYNKTASMAMEEFSIYMESCRVSWSGICVPTAEWAKKVFPDLDEKAAIEELWNKIFAVTRVDQNDPINAWSGHIENLRRRLDYLNSKRYKKLHYKSTLTNLSMELPEDHVWIGGGVNNEKGVYFVPNIPTEEIFTMPLKYSVNGVVGSTRPLNARGRSIRNFTFRIENGRIVDFSAEEGYEILKSLVEMDEGSHYIGEVALVSCDSPIASSGITFNSTLFDENASCHFAFGMAYPLCIKGGADMSREELEKNGANTSLTHVDFMIGSQDLSIYGETEDGHLEAIFINGNWAI